MSARLGSYEGQVLALSLAAVIAAMNGDVNRERQLYNERLELAQAARRLPSHR
ncbi:MAG: hypothetical protein WKF73_16675 [Nocardioidaceae bacterium]